MGVSFGVIAAGLGLLVAGAVVLGGAWAAVGAGIALIVMGVLVDWERLS